MSKNTSKAVISINQSSDTSHIPISTLAGRTILITGGKGKLGTFWANSLKRSGAEVIIWDLPEVDVSNPTSVLKAAEGVIPYGVINAAAVDCPPESNDVTMTQLFGVNVVGTYNVCTMFAENMLEGAIINIASLYALVSPFWNKPIGYGASKAAVVQMTRQMACQYPHLRINSVCFGGVEADQPEWFKQEYSERAPIGRMAKPWEYDDVIKFMLTTTYMTGSNLVVDGGWTAM